LRFGTRLCGLEHWFGDAPHPRLCLQQVARQRLRSQLIGRHALTQRGHVEAVQVRPPRVHVVGCATGSGNTRSTVPSGAMWARQPLFSRALDKWPSSSSAAPSGCPGNLPAGTSCSQFIHCSAGSVDRYVDSMASDFVSANQAQGPWQKRKPGYRGRRSRCAQRSPATMGRRRCLHE